MTKKMLHKLIILLFIQIHQLLMFYSYSIHQIILPQLQKYPIKIGFNLSILIQNSTNMEIQCQDSIQVVIRIRPLFKQVSHNYLVHNENQIKLGRNNFKFDRIFSAECIQEDVFNSVGLKVVTHTLQGYNSCIFAYGQTGSGKTHTMIGNGNGIIQRSLEQLFFSMSNNNSSSQYVINCSYFEIYNQQLVDLLDQTPKKLTVREDIKKGVFVENLVEENVDSVERGIQLLNQGIRSRHIGQTLMNRESSRSHAVFTLIIQSKCISNQSTTLKSSKLHFVDLAGSERQKATACVGQRLKQASNINKSLTTLGMVINNLSSEKQRLHIPFRDSKLTFVLRDSLGGNSKTFIIATISGNPQSFQQTLSTLKFAQRAKMVKMRAQINEQSLSGNIQALKAEIRRLKDELYHAKQQLQQERSKSKQGKSHCNQLIVNLYNKNITQINQKISNIMCLLPQAVQRNKFDDICTTGPEKFAEYFNTNKDILLSINTNLNSFLGLKQQLRTKASLQKLRLQQMKTPMKTEREQLQQLSIAKSAEIIDSRHRILQLTNDTIDRDKQLQKLQREMLQMKSHLSQKDQEIKYLKDYYESKQEQLLHEIQKHSNNSRQNQSDSNKNSENQLVAKFKESYERQAEEYNMKINRINTDLNVKVHEVQMLANNLINLKKTVAQLTIDKESAQRLYKNLEIDYLAIKEYNLSMEQKLDMYTQQGQYLQKELQNLLVDREKDQSRFKDALTAYKQQQQILHSDLKIKLLSFEEKSSQLSSQIEILNETIDFKNTQIEELKTYSNDCRKQYELLTFEYSQFKSQYSKVISEINKQNLTLNDKLFLLQKHEQEYKRKCLQYQHELTLKDQQIVEIQKQIIQRQLQLTELRGQYNILQQEKTEIVQQILRMQQEQTIREQSFVKQRELINRKYNQDLNSQRREWQERMTLQKQSKQSQIAYYTQMVVNLQQKHLEYQQTTERNRKEILEAYQKLSQTKNHIEELKKNQEREFQKKQKQFSLCNIELTQNNALLQEQLNHQLSQFESFKQNTQNRYNQLTIQYQSQQNQLIEHKNQLVKLTEEFAKLELLRSDCERELQKKNIQIFQMINLHANKIQQITFDHQQKLQKSQRSLLEQIHTNKRLDQEINLLSEENTKISYQLSSLIQKYEELKTISQNLREDLTTKFQQKLLRMCEQKKQLNDIYQKEKNYNQQLINQNNKIKEIQQSTLCEFEQTKRNLEKCKTEIDVLTDKLQSIPNANELKNIKEQIKINREKSQDLMVQNYRLKNLLKATNREEDTIPILEKKVAYYQNKFNLMKIEYNNSVDAVRKLKEKELGIRQQNEKLKERLKSMQIQNQLSNKDELKVKLQQQNAYLKQNNMQLKQALAKFHEEKTLGSKKGENKQNFKEQLHEIKKERENLYSTMNLVKRRIVNTLENFGEASERVLIKSIHTNNDETSNDPKEILKALQIFQELVKKKENILSKNIKKQERIKMQNSLTVKQNIYLKQKLKELQQSERQHILQQQKKSMKKVKRQ